MATDTQLAQILQIIGNSKLFSELSEQTVLTDDSFFASINTGTEDAKKIKIPLLRGFSGDWNADTNTPNLSNGSGVSGTVYKINVAGSQDLGNGTVDYVVDQLIYYNSSQWVKLSQSKISDITGLREELDTLQENIDAEAITRGDADTTLQTNINNVEQSLEDNVQAEQDARIAEDIVLQENIDTESTTRSDADVALQGNIDAEASTRQSSDTTLQSNIDLKIDIASIVDNVTAGGSGVPLSAEQGKVLKAEILALEGSLIPQGNWDADTNTPDISGTTQTGYYWIVSVAGSTDLDGETDWKVNDWAIKTADGFAKIDNTDKVLSVAGKIGEVVLAKADVGLSNVDNTTDANKPISTAQQTALDLKANLAGGNTITGEQKHNNSGTGTAIDVNNTSTGTGIDVLNNLGGFGLYVNNNGTGSAIEVAGTSSGFNFVGKDNAVNTFTVDKEGNVIGLSFSGDGSLLTNMPVSSAQQTALDLKANKASPSFTGDATFESNINTAGDGNFNDLIVGRAESGGTDSGNLYFSEDRDFAWGVVGFGGFRFNLNGATNDLKFQSRVGTSTAKDIFTVNRDNADFLVHNDFETTGNATFGGDVEIDKGDLSRLRISGNGNNGADNEFGTIEFFNKDTSGSSPNVASSIKALSSSSTGSGGFLTFSTSVGNEAEGTDAIERMRIDANGDFDFKSGNATFGGDVSLLSGYTSTGVYPVEKGITFQTTNGSSVWKTGEILGYVIANNGTTSDFPGGLVFRTKIPGTATEGMLDAMFLSSQGDLEAVGNATFGGDTYFGTTGTPNGTSVYGSSFESASSNRMILRLASSSSSSADLAYFINSNGVVGTIRTNGSSTLFSTSSDYRLKEDLKDFNGLQMVSDISVYDYKWKTDETRSFGVMAHELQEVLPDAVSGEKDAEEMQGVDYSKIVPLLIKSIQELTAKVQALENK